MATQRSLRVIGDDWQFTFTATTLSGSPPTVTPMNLAGYQPGGVLFLPNGATPYQIFGNVYVDMTQLSIGQFTLLVPASETATFVPDENCYRLQVYLINPANYRQTYGIVPLKVVMA